jgi:glucose/arabinose dehydrogenase/plastocyanin
MIAGAALLAGCGDDAGREARVVTAPTTSAEPARLPDDAPALVDIGAGLKGPDSLAAQVLMRGVTNVTDFAFDRDGRMFVTRGSEGAHHGDGVWLLRRDGRPRQVVGGLAAPLGLTFVGDDLYVASEERVDRYSGFAGTHFAGHRTVLSDLPAGKLGWNDNLRAGPDGRLYMGIGSPCDACLPKENLAATIVSFRPDGSDLRVFADDVRGNAFLAFLPGTDRLFMATNQVNAGGADSPPDEFGLVEEGSKWGNPWCLRREGDACAGVARPLATLDTHAVLDGIAFLPSSWGPQYARTAVVSEWGPGKLVAIALKPRGRTFTATPSVLVTGVKNPGPLATTPDGGLLVGEYRSGTIYRIAPGQANRSAPAEPATTTAPAPPASSARTVAFAADPSGQLKFTRDAVTAEAGDATISFQNPTTIPHDVQIDRDGTPVAKTEEVTEGTGTADAKLEPGRYTFFCTVPGHRDAGMVGILTVK